LPDVAVKTYTGISGSNIAVLLGNGDGTFRLGKQTVLPDEPLHQVGTLAVGDFDGDGKPDLAVVTYTNLEIMQGQGDGTFRLTNSYSVPSSTPRYAVVADLNRDGKLDIVLSNWNSSGLSVLMNNGGGSFAPARTVLARATAGVAIGDFNGDGILDLAAPDQVSSVFILQGNGDGTFAAPREAYNRTLSHPNGIVGMARDLNGDGKVDLVFASYGVTVLIANGDGTFQAPMDFPSSAYPPPTGGGATWDVADLNADGKLDILAGCSMLAGNGDGTFLLPVQSACTGAFGDFNRDGKVDVAHTAPAGGFAVDIYLGVGLGPQSGWWWDPKLNGTGFFIEAGGRSGQGLFIGGFLYDQNGTATWLVSTGVVKDGAYQGRWLRASGGQQLGGGYKKPTTEDAGPITLVFTDPTHAILTRPDNTTIHLQRFSFTEPRVPPPQLDGTPQTGWWWNGDLFSGTGFGLEVQGSSLFLVAYFYDINGNPVWYLATGNLVITAIGTSFPIYTSQFTGTWDTYAGGPQLLSPEGNYSGTKQGSSGTFTLSCNSALVCSMTMNGGNPSFTRFSSF
jgi:hypothetical protein